MFGKLIDKFTGKDDLERVASREDLPALNACLKTRRVFIPRRPTRSLDASSFTEDQLVELIRLESEESAANGFEPWILEIDGKKRLPAFSSLKKLEVFVGKISEKMDQIFAIDSAEVLIADVTNSVEIDFVDLNLFSEKSWEIGMRGN